MTELFATTGDAVVRITSHANVWDVKLTLENSGAQCLALDPHHQGTLYVGTHGNGVWKSSDNGETWQDMHLPQQDVFSIAVSAADGTVYAGCEPSMLFGSGDGGQTWSDQRPDAQRDVHALAWHPKAAGRAYEAGGGGAAWSKDGGKTWQRVDAGRDRNYTWGLAVDPDDPDCWFISACPGPREAHYLRGNAQAYIYRWRGDGPWQALDGGLPQPLRHMPYALVSGPGSLYAGLSNGQVYVSHDRGDSWHMLSLKGDVLPSILALGVAS